MCLGLECHFTGLGATGISVSMSACSTRAVSEASGSCHMGLCWAEAGCSSREWDILLPAAPGSGSPGI
jgi:hypothetical protein